MTLLRVRIRFSFLFGALSATLAGALRARLVSSALQNGALPDSLLPMVPELDSHTRDPEP